MNLLILTLRHGALSAGILSLALWSIICAISFALGITLGFAATLTICLAIAFGVPVALHYLARWVVQRGAPVQVVWEAEMLDWLRSNVRFPLYDVAFPTQTMLLDRVHQAVMAGTSLPPLTVAVKFADPRDAVMFKLVWGGGS